MAARNLSSSPRFVAGNATPKIIAVVVVLALAGAGAWFLFGRGSGPAATSTQATQAPTDGTPAAPGAVTPAAPAAPAIDTLSVDQLYKEARTALNEQRMVSPVGNNALEFYIKILEKQPSDSGARDAIRELFSTFAASAESAISARNFDEGRRIMDLLAKADPNNYTLTILKSKLDAQQKLADREQAQAQAKAEAEAKRAAALLGAGKPEAAKPAAAAGQHVILIGAFANPGNVKVLQTKLNEIGVKSYTENLDSPQGAKTRVRAGPFPSKEAAEKALDKMKKIGVNGIVSAK